jgi:uncharacterized protein YeaO (DUF488 family)
VFREASVYEPRGKGWQVLVMRHWPRGVKRSRVDAWLRDAAPSAELLAAYRAGELEFDELAARYRAELRPEVIAELRRLAREHGDVTVLCWERRPAPCHRHVLLDALRARRRARGGRRA